MTVTRKDLFDLPDGVIYLDGNSLGPLPKAVTERVMETLQHEWGHDLIRAWNTRGWMDQPRILGDKLARLIGATKGSVMVGDTLSIQVFQALSAALDMRPDRRVIVSDTENFPSDLYILEGLLRLKDKDYTLRVVPPHELADAIDDRVAAVLLTHVDYRSGARHEMNRMTPIAHEAGAVMIWDLAHSAGAVPVDVTSCTCEFAVGCTYKYLNAGPGAPAFIYIRPDLIPSVTPALTGWLGHAAPFEFDRNYHPAGGIGRMRIGTPPILQMAALDAALALWDNLDLSELWKASQALCDHFIARVEQTCPDLKLVTPRGSDARGSHVSFACEHGYPVMQALIDRGVIGDFRAPNIMRFGIAPLYLDTQDIDRAVEILREVLDHRLWDHAKYVTRQTVT
ncbi:MAG: kynureninase [Pseudomonadota bacterium]